MNERLEEKFLDQHKSVFFIKTVWGLAPGLLRQGAYLRESALESVFALYI